MNCDRREEQIQALVDGMLDAAGRRDLEAHLAVCPSCRVLASDLQRIRRTAATLDRLAPPARVWKSIARHLERNTSATPAASVTPPAGRIRTFRLGPLSRVYIGLAAAALLLLITGSVTFVLRYRTDPARDLAAGSASARPAENGSTSEATAGGDQLVESVQNELNLAEQHYDKAIKGLEQIAKSEEASLDPQLAATLRKNLGVIDQAISESRAALRSQPGSAMAQESLFEALRRKVGLLQDTIALMNEMRKGNQAGAAQIVEGLNKS